MPITIETIADGLSGLAVARRGETHTCPGTGDDRYCTDTTTRDSRYCLGCPAIALLRTRFDDPEFNPHVVIGRNTIKIFPSYKAP